jgi:hypothetical protein
MIYKYLLRRKFQNQRKMRPRQSIKRTRPLLRGLLQTQSGSSDPSFFSIKIYEEDYGFIDLAI